MDDEKTCVAPELCIRCRPSRDYYVEVVFNTDACTCSDDDVCLHSKMVRKKKFVLIVWFSFSIKPKKSSKYRFD